MYCKGLERFERSVILRLALTSCNNLPGGLRGSSFTCSRSQPLLTVTLPNLVAF